MNFGFDLDDTITAEPAPFACLMAALVSAGHEVHVITGVMPGITRPDLETAAGRRKQLGELGMAQGTHFSELHLAIGIGANAIALRKRELCEELGIALMFEDRSDYANAMRYVTRCLLMWPRESL